MRSKFFANFVQLTAFSKRYPLKLRVPAKTFLVGEYLALSGGPSLIATTLPHFELKADNWRGTNPFAKNSPGGKLWSREASKLEHVELKFRDPYEKAGGLGASSAQFGLLYAYLNRHRIADGFDYRELLEIYRQCAWEGVGQPPSGADLVAQLVGGVTYFDGRLFEAERLNWPFPDLVFTLVRTGFKVATHEHLKEKQNVPEERLRALVQEAKEALKDENSTQFSAAVENYGVALAQAGLLHGESAQLIEALRKANDELGLGVTAAKGCGAMGADIILVLHKVKQAAQLRGWFELRGLKICGTEKELSPTGLEIEELS